MADEKGTCPLCEQAASYTEQRATGFIREYSGCACGRFFLWPSQLALAMDDVNRKRIVALLHERSLKELPVPALWFGDDHARELSDVPTLRVRNLLASWPATVPERLDRCLCNLATGWRNAGELIKLPNPRKPDYLFFTDDPDEERYYIRALIDYGRIVDSLSHMTARVLEITPRGWARIHELAGGAELRNNPAFVAMWFGGREAADRERMTRRFEDIIRPACYDDCGWNAGRGDSLEHNDSVIDRIVEMIRVAPFVIADLSDENKGVYYEAGFARGRDVPVIYLVHEEAKVHFDVTGVNHVRWRTDAELRTRLKNRILGTMGRGPHKLGGGE